MDQRPLALSRHPLIHTGSLEEARHIYSRLNTPVTLETIGRRKDFEWRANLAAVGPMAISTSRFGCSFRGFTDAVEDIFSMVFPLAQAGGEVAHAGTRLPLVAGRTAYLASPLVPSEVRMDRGYECVQVVIRRPLVEAALAALTGSTARTPLRFEPLLSTASGTGAAVLRLLRFLIEELDQEHGALSSPLIAARYADILLYTLLTGQPHNHAGVLSSRPRSAEPRHVRRIAEYLDAHAAEPVSLAELQAVAGVSIRAIHAGFRTYRGCTPMAFLRQRRLELARTRLLSSPGATVTEIALQCGFEHLGRFSALYRARFGESPADTLRRAGGGT